MRKNVGRKRNRWLRWKRYQERSDKLTGRHSRLFNGAGNAYMRYMYANRYYPIGVRDVRV